MQRTFLMLLVVAFCSFAFATQPAADGDAAVYQDEGFKVRSKPSAKYTRKAKASKVEGVVRLRVTLLSNGKIGEIFDETRDNADVMRESGLTDSAIKAARKIKFTPAKKDGNPVEVTALFEYVFNLT